MTKNEISYSVAFSLAVEQARRVLRGFFPADESAAFEHSVIFDENFWLFFRNRNIVVPDIPNGGISDNCAFAIGRHGLFLTVEDNYDDNNKLGEQIKRLSEYFANHDR